MCIPTRDSDIPRCPRCKGQEIWRNGKNSAGNQQWRCRFCDRVFVVEPYLSAIVTEIADRLLAEKIPVVVCARVMEDMVSKSWLYKRRRIVNAG